MTDTTAKRLDRDELQAIFKRSPFIGRMNLEVLAMDHEQARLRVRMPLSEEYERRHGKRPHVYTSRASAGAGEVSA